MAPTPSFTAPDQFSSLSFPIVAIGGAAGSVEALSELLAHLTPATGMAYIFIQHADRADSKPADDDPVTVFSQATTMPVVAATDQLPIQPNTLYVIAAQSEPEHDPKIIDGQLTFVPRPLVNPPAINLPIDRFFVALADHHHDGLIAILLSGTASDGTLGMRAIRATGGLTFAQDETALFQGMPRSAIAESLIDRVLAPADMARELEQISQQLTVLREAIGANAAEKVSVVLEGDQPETEQPEESTEPDDVGDELSKTTAGTEAESSEVFAGNAEADLWRILQLLWHTTGNDFSLYKLTTIRRRIIRRMLLLRFETLHDYAEYLYQNAGEIQALYDDLLINVTTFFRDSDLMDYVHKVLLPRLVANKKPSEPVRIWVPACSTGQEAYSIAILLLEVLSEKAMSLPIQLFATDLSEPAVTKARLGTYTRGEITEVSPQRLQRFFTKVDDHYRINKSVRDLCVFATHNLLENPPFSRLDLVSCRNLLIYLDAQLQQKAIATFHYALNDNGHLILGKSETVGTLSPYFSVVESSVRVFARKNDATGRGRAKRSLFDLNARLGQARTSNGSKRAPAYLTAGKPNGVGAPNEPDRNQASSSVQRSMALKATSDLDKAVDGLLSRYVPASVVVNAELDILQFRGSTGLFLEPSPGRASLNLLKMARTSLVFELRNIIQKAGMTGKPVRRSGLEVKIKDTTHYVAIEALAFSVRAEEQLFLVLFDEEKAILTAQEDATEVRSNRIKQLEEELSTLRDDMRLVTEEQEAAREELQSANEEIISSNEELQSINEELETSKEEIESTNEELLTINQELQVRNDQLSEAHAFAEAIFGTIREATLVLTADLRVKSANSVFYTLFGLNKVDTEGRLIYELANRQWNIPQLRSLLTDVATSNVPIQGFELTYSFPGVGKKVLSLNARRVVRQEAALLLAIEDITEHRRSQQFLREREAWFHHIADNAPALIWVAGADGQFTFLNTAWLAFTGRSTEDVIVNGLLQLLHPDERQRYEQVFQSSLKTHQPFQIEYRLRRRDGEYHWMLENAQPTFASDGQFTGFIGTAADVQGQKELNAELDRLVAQRTTELTGTNIKLQKSTEALQGVLDSSPASIVLLKAIRSTAGDIMDLEVLAANQHFAQLIRQPLEQAVTLKASQLGDWLWGLQTLDRLAHVIRTGQSFYVEQTSPDNSWIALSVTKHDDGVVVIGLDITELRQMQHQRESLLDQVKQANGMAEQLDVLKQQAQTRGEMLRASSHDLRGSLGVIQGAAGLLPFADSDDEREQMLEMLQRNVEETVRLIAELLDFSRLETGQQQMQVAPFDAADLLRKLGENVRPLVARKGLDLQLAGPETLPVEGDWLNVFRIAQNIVLNALKYTQEGRIVVQWDCYDPDEWCFSVVDTGPGMEQSLADRLPHGTNANPASGESINLFTNNLILSGLPGEGIGLMIVRQLCSLLQGRLVVESELGWGSTFRVMLPCRY